MIILEPILFSMVIDRLTDEVSQEASWTMKVKESLTEPTLGNNIIKLTGKLQWNYNAQGSRRVIHVLRTNTSMLNIIQLESLILYL